MTANNVSPSLERQFVGGLALLPGLLGSYPAHDFLTDPMARSAYKALGIARTANPATMAELMSKNGYPEATEDLIRDEFIKPATEWPIDIPSTHKYLAELYLKRTGLPLIKEYLDAAESGKSHILDGGRELLTKLYGHAGAEEARSVSTDDAVLFIEERAREQRELAAAGKIAKFPAKYADLHKSIKSMSKGILGILFDTSRGKTVFMQDIAEQRAIDYGRNAVFIMTEATREEMLWRAIARRTGIPYDQLEAGYVSDATRAALKPFPNGSRITYKESNGMPLTAAIAAAERDNADLYLDVIYGLNWNEFKGKGDTNSNKYERGLEALEAFTQRTKHLVAFTLQTDKQGRRNSRQDGGMLSFEDCREGGVFEDKCSVALVGNSKRAGVGGHSLPHPLDATKMISVNPGWPLPVVNIQIAKNRGGPSLGKSQLAWLEGARYDFIPLNRGYNKEGLDLFKEYEKEA